MISSLPSRSGYLTYTPSTTYARTGVWTPQVKRARACRELALRLASGGRDATQRNATTSADADASSASRPSQIRRIQRDACSRPRPTPLMPQPHRGQGIVYSTGWPLLSFLCFCVLRSTGSGGAGGARGPALTHWPSKATPCGCARAQERDVLLRRSTSVLLPRHGALARSRDGRLSPARLAMDAGRSHARRRGPRLCAGCARCHAMAWAPGSCRPIHEPGVGRSARPAAKAPASVPAFVAPSWGQPSMAVQHWHCSPPRTGESWDRFLVTFQVRPNACWTVRLPAPLAYCRTRPKPNRNTTLDRPVLNRGKPKAVPSRPV